MSTEKNYVNKMFYEIWNYPLRSADLTKPFRFLILIVKLPGRASKASIAPPGNNTAAFPVPFLPLKM